MPEVQGYWVVKKLMPFGDAGQRPTPFKNKVKLAATGRRRKTAKSFLGSPVAREPWASRIQHGSVRTSPLFRNGVRLFPAVFHIITKRPFRHGRWWYIFYLSTFIKKPKSVKNSSQEIKPNIIISLSALPMEMVWSCPLVAFMAGMCASAEWEEIRNRCKLWR